MTDELKKDCPVDLARIRDLASGRDEWFAMGREEKSYFINFGDEWNAVRWMDDQKKRMSEWVEREGVHLVKQHVFSELEKLANAAANEIETLRAILQAATRDTVSADEERLRQLEHALVYVAHSMHSEPQYMLAEGITLGDVRFVRVKIADIDVSVGIPESVARAMYDAAMQMTARKADERRKAIAASAPKEDGND